MKAILVLLIFSVFAGIEVQKTNLIDIELEKNEANIENQSDPGDPDQFPQDYYMSLLSNEQGQVCFRCELPGSECSLYPKTCFD